MPVNQAKFQQVILYLCQKLGGSIDGKKKLAKLLYFADFDYFEKTGHSITGDVYKALPMGPFPTSLEAVTTQMSGSRALQITQVKKWDGLLPVEIYHATVAPAANVLDEDERQMLDRVVQKYGHLTGKQLEDLSHAEAPYVASNLNDVIPYELAYYRGMDFDMDRLATSRATEMF